jgi:hypothetical protein
VRLVPRSNTYEYRKLRSGAEEKWPKTGQLDQYGRNLTAYAEEDKLDPVIGREQEIARICMILVRRTENNPVITLNVTFEPFGKDPHRSAVRRPHCEALRKPSGASGRMLSAERGLIHRSV